MRRVERLCCGYGGGPQSHKLKGGGGADPPCEQLQQHKGNTMEYSNTAVFPPSTHPFSIFRVQFELFTGFGH